MHKPAFTLKVSFACGAHVRAILLDKFVKAENDCREILQAVEKQIRDAQTQYRSELGAEGTVTTSLVTLENFESLEEEEAETETLHFRRNIADRIAAIKKNEPTQ